MTHVQALRRLATAFRRLERAETTGAPLARLRLLQNVEAALLAVAATLREDVAKLAGEILDDRERP